MSGNRLVSYPRRTSPLGSYFSFIFSALVSIMLRIDPKVGMFFHNLLQIPKGCNLFTNTLDSCYTAVQELNRKGVKITGVASEVLTKAVSDTHDREWHIVGHEDISFFRPDDMFHIALTVPPYDIQEDVRGELAPTPINVRDRMMLFECSKGKDSRVVPAQLMCLEACLSSIMEGGYFGAVLPRKWIGRDMKFMRWWEEAAAMVARIALPSEAVQCRGEHDEWIDAPGEWILGIWQRPSDGKLPATSSIKHRKKTEYAAFRYTTFIFPLESLQSYTLNECGMAFRKNDWWLNNIKLWRKMLDNNSQHMWCGTYHSEAKPIANPEDIWFFEPNETNTPSVKVVHDIKKMKEIRLGVHVKPGPPVKLTTYCEYARAVVHDVLLSSGIEHQSEDDGYSFKMNDELRRMHYSEIREHLVQNLCHRGLKPFMSTMDNHRLEKSERWLSIQLTPIERNIPIRGQEHLIADSDEPESDVENGLSEYEVINWETVYEDLGMHATFPEILAMWTKRAEKMLLRQFMYDFQFEDVVMMAAKQSCLNADVMGLGKTRQTLFVPYLRGCRKALIILPAKLIGEWQNEIEDVIVPFVKRVRRNWQGDIIRADYRVVKYAADILDRRSPMFTFISYDKLKAVPRDGKFFMCPKCKFVVFSVKEKERQLCPVCNKDSLKKWKAKCKKADLRKHKVSLSSGKKIPWSNPEKERCRIVDRRPPRTAEVRMQPKDHIFKKMHTIVTGYKSNPVTGIKEPIKIERPRSFHVAWTFAELVRLRFNFIAADEALYFKTTDSQRTKAMHHLCGRTRIALTGTPVKGFPQNILSLLNWTFAQPVFPSYRSYDTGGLARFMRKYETKVKIESKVGIKWKQVPKINNPELFQAEISPLMLRRTRNEPNVLKDIPKKYIEHKVILLKMDPEQREYYSQWQAKFSEWWQLMKEEVEGRKVKPGEIMTKLMYLRNASVAPHFMLDNISKSKDEQMQQWALLIGKYQHGKKQTPVAKMLKTREIIKQAISKGDKVIVFSWRQKNLRLGKLWCENVGINSLIVDGSVPLEIRKGTNRSPRQELIDKFRNYDYSVMWAGMSALSEGLNIPEANWGIFFDYDWEPSTWAQALGRMIRPQQTKTVHARFLVHEGTVDSYMAAWCFLKQRAVEEGVDYMDFDDFSAELIPDVTQYADSIVDGTEESLKAKMWLAVEHIRKQAQEEE